MFFPYIRERLMRPKVDQEVDFYQNFKSEEILLYQLQRFNKLWEDIQKNIPYYREKVEENEIPSKINNMYDFLKLPITDRKEARKYIDIRTDKSRKPDSWVSTGGSTGTPLIFPSWKEEAKNYEPSLWYARSFYDIKRSDRMYRLWGHSHALGEGLAKYKKIIAFKIGHPLIGYKRFSAYDLSEKRLRIAGEEIIRFKPKYIIGYSKALYMLAKANEDRRSEFHKLNLKAVIGAAEGFESDNDKILIGDIFGSPVGLEYASMETKILAHTHPDGGYRAIWRNNLIECVDDQGNPSSEGRVLVTSLYPRAFPLIRYELGDIVSGCDKDDISVYAFRKVKGRDNDFLILDDGTPVHSEGITHAIKFSKKIIAYQIRYKTDKNYTIYVKSDEMLDEIDIQEVRRRLIQVDSRLGKLPIKQTDQLKQTIAGKTKWLIEE